VVSSSSHCKWRRRAFKNSQISDFKGLTRDLNVGSGHTAYRRASLIDLYPHAKFHWNRRNILWTGGCMDRRTDAWMNIWDRLY